MDTAKVLLLAGGAFIEFVGIVLIGSPDLAPWATRLVNWGRPRWRGAVDRVRRLVGLRPRPTVVNVSGGASVGVSGGLAALALTTNEDNSLEEKVAFLLRRDQESQRNANELGRRVTRLEEDAPRQLEKLREHMEEHVDKELAAAAATDRAVRQWGTGALAVGLALMTVGNFI